MTQHPPIYEHALEAVRRAVHHGHPGHHPLPATLTEETPMASSLTDAIRNEAHDALDEILNRYLTPTNLAHALAEALDTTPPAAPLVPLPPAPTATDTAVLPDDADQNPA